MAIPNSPEWSAIKTVSDYPNTDLVKPSPLFINSEYDVSLGPINLNDSQGRLDSRYWFVYQNSDTNQILVCGAEDNQWGEPVELFSEADTVWEISLTFDQLGRPLVFYRINQDTLKLFWYNPVLGDIELRTVGNGRSPHAAFDVIDDAGVTYSDALLFYARGNYLYMRVQRERFETEYLTPAYGKNIFIHSSGMNIENRFQVVYRSDYDSTPENQRKALTFTRNSNAYDFNMVELPFDTPALEPFQIPVSKFEIVDNIYPDVPFDPAVVKWTYTEALTHIKAFAADYANEGWVYENLCETYEALQSGLEHPTLGYKLDEGRPVLILQNATHGNEKHSLMGIMKWLEEVMTSDRPELVWVRENMSIMVMCIQNPNGWNLDRRRNGTDTSSVYTGVNLNRNWDYFWEYAADPDKGSEPFSEIENRNFRSWLELNNRIQDGILFIDFHSWWSRSIYGMLTDHNFNHGMKIQTMQRSIWRYSNYLMKNRNWDGYTLNGGLDNMVLSERSSTRKPYAPYWGQQRMQKYRGYCFQVEVPQGDESQAVNAQVILDVMTACSYAMRDYMQPEQLGIKIDKAVAETDILNTNSLFANWSTSYNRPQYFRSEGVVLVNNQGRADIHRPLSAAWPRASFDSASCSYIHPTNQHKSFFVVAGGEIEGNVETTAVYLEMMMPPEPPPVGSNEYGIYKSERPQVKIDSLPKPIKSGAMVYCNGYIWHFMGHKGNQGYEAGIYRLPVTTDSDDVAEEMDAKQWEFVKNTTHYANGGLQRHRVVAVGTDIMIIGGRDSDDYSRDIVKFDTTDFSETLVGQVGYKNGWFGIERIPNTDTFVYFGGWNGASTKDDVFIIDFTDVNAPVITRKASMPSTRRTMTWGIDEADNTLYVMSGEVNEDEWTTDILAYDITNDTWTTLTQTDDGTGANEYSYSKELDDEEETFDIANITLGRAAMAYNPYTRTLNTIAGEIDDGTGSAPTITFFEFNTEELALSARKVNDVTWGLVKPSTSWPISAGHLSTVVASVRNEMQWIDEDELKINPYVRSLNYVGPTWSSTTRWRHKYLVAPRLTQIAVPCYAPEPYLSNSRIYAYLRLYGEGTKISSQGLQIIDNKLLTPRMVPETGMAAESAYYTIGSEVLEIEGAYFSPLNERFDETLKVAKFIGESFTINLLHTYNPTAGTGIISIEVIDNSTNGVVATYVLDNFVTNYDAYTNMYKRDIINFRLVNKGYTEFETWIYGKRSIVAIPEIGLFFNCTRVEANYDDASRVGIGFYLEGVDV